MIKLEPGDTIQSRVPRGAIASITYLKLDSYPKRLYGDIEGDVISFKILSEHCPLDGKAVIVCEYFIPGETCIRSRVETSWYGI